MAHSNGKITAPVGVDSDIAPVLGVGNYDVGYLCGNAHGKINKWAKYKPVRQPYMDERANYWKANDGGCGLQIAAYTSPGSLSSGFLKDLFAGVQWGYLPPYGGDAAPYRALDFDGYNHNAIQPFGEAVPTDVYLSATNSLEIQIEQTTTASDNILLSDLSANGVTFTNMYAGVGLMKGSSALIATSTAKFNNGATIKLDNMGGYTGTWKIAFFLSSMAIAVGGSMQAGTYVALPITPRNIVIHAQGTLQTVEGFGSWNKANTQITYNYIIKNNGGSAVTVSGVTLILVRSKTLPSAGESVKTLISNAEHYVTAKGTFTSDIKVTSATRDSSYQYYIAAKATGVTTTYTPIEDDVSEM